MDTSSAMRRRATATEKAIENLLRSGISAQLRDGDTLGVWTFNEQLSAGRFPLQHWTPETADAITTNILAFLRLQKYEHEPRFSVVIPALDQLIRASERLTILLVSAGNERISGTPFDRDIRAAVEANYDQQRKQQMPFITVLRVSRGRIIRASVNLAPWPVDLPAFPPEPKIVEAPKTNPPPAAPKPRPMAPPLIVIGKKPETNAPPAQTNAVTPAGGAANSPANPQTVAPTQTISTARTSAPQFEATTNLAARPAALPALTNKLQAVVLDVPPSAETDKSTTAQDAGGARTGSRELFGAQPADASRAGAATSAPPAQVAVAVPPEAASGFKIWLLIGGGGVTLLAVLGGLIFAWQRRAHAAHASLITRSLERERK